MNERLNELKRQAVAEADVTHIDFDNLSHTDIQILGDAAVEKKFAELIIEECCQALWTDACHISDLAIIEFNSNTRKIKRHFGVE